MDKFVELLEKHRSLGNVVAYLAERIEKLEPLIPLIPVLQDQCAGRVAGEDSAAKILAGEVTPPPDITPAGAMAGTMPVAVVEDNGMTNETVLKTHEQLAAEQNSVKADDKFWRNPNG